MEIYKSPYILVIEDLIRWFRRHMTDTLWHNNKDFTYNDYPMRFLNPSDLDTVKALCEECFPVKYPDSWFHDITSGRHFYSLAALDDDQIVGIIVAEIKNKLKCNPEDSDILASWFHSDTQIVYILSLGVTQNYRNVGIASKLLSQLIHHVTTDPQCRSLCKAVYLHVLWSNNLAIRFYEKRGFRMHNRISNYYMIRGIPADGYTYVLYVNGGEPPMSALEYLQSVSQSLLSLCNYLCSCFSHLSSNIRRCLLFICYKCRHSGNKPIRTSHRLNTCAV